MINLQNIMKTPALRIKYYSRITAIIFHLEKLAVKEIDPNDPEFGICEELHFMYQVSYKSYIPYFRSWKHFSGNFSYPILTHHFKHTPYYKNNDKDNAQEEFYNTLDLWDDEFKQGKLRLDLCKHIANELRKQMGMKENGYEN